MGLSKNGAMGRPQNQDFHGNGNRPQKIKYKQNAPSFKLIYNPLCNQPQ